MNSVSCKIEALIMSFEVLQKKAKDGTMISYKKAKGYIKGSDLLLNISLPNDYAVQSGETLQLEGKLWIWVKDGTLAMSFKVQ